MGAAPAAPRTTAASSTTAAPTATAAPTTTAASSTTAAFTTTAAPAATAARTEVPVEDDGKNGFQRCRKSFAMLHEQVESDYKKYDMWDKRRCPIATVEMRCLQRSNAYLSPGYHPRGDR